MLRPVTRSVISGLTPFLAGRARLLACFTCSDCLDERISGMLRTCRQIRRVEVQIEETCIRPNSVFGCENSNPKCRFAKLQAPSADVPRFRAEKRPARESR